MRSEQVGGAYCTYCCFSHLIESEADPSRSQDAFDMITNHFVTHGRSNARTLWPAEKEHTIIPLDTPWPWANSHFYLQYETSSSSPGHTKIQFSLIRSRVAHATLSQTIVRKGENPVEAWSTSPTANNNAWANSIQLQIMDFKIMIFTYSETWPFPSQWRA